MAPARSTDGSARVSTTNQPINASVAAHRVGGRARLQHRAGRRQQQRDVLSRHRGEVAQAGGPEAVDHRRRLVPVVADEQPARQRRPVRRERGGAPLDQLAHPVRRRRGRRAGRHVAEPVDVELAHDVLPRDTSSSTRRQRDPVAVDAHPIAGVPLRDAQATGATAHPHLVALSVDDQHDAIGARGPIRLADDRHPTRERSERIRLQRRPRRIAPPHGRRGQRPDGEGEARRPHDTGDRAGGDRDVPPPRSDRDGHRDGHPDHVGGPRRPRGPNRRMPMPGGRLAVASSHRALNHVSTRVRRPALVPAAHPQPRSVPRRDPAVGARRHLAVGPEAVRRQHQWLHRAHLRGLRGAAALGRRRPLLRLLRCTRSALPSAP